MKILRVLLRLTIMTTALILVLLIADAAYAPLQSGPWQSMTDPAEVPPAVAQAR